MTRRTSKPFVESCAYHLVPYRKGDEREILALFEEVFHGKRGLEHWTWQFENNPYGPPQALLARDPANLKVVAQYTVMPVPLNLMGRQAKAAQSLDTMVHPDYRMHGIFEASARECFQKLKAEEYALVYGFPNRNSYPGFVRKLNWNRVAFMKSFYKRLSIKTFLLGFLRIPLLTMPFDWAFRLVALLSLVWTKVAVMKNQHGLRAHVSTKVPPGYDELWDKVRGLEVLSVWKDAKYFAWRYDSNPSHSFTYHYLERAGKIDALAVVVESNGAWDILELVARDRCIPVCRSLVASIGIAALKAGASRISFTGTSLDFFSEVFKGFSKEISFSHVFCLLNLGEQISPLTAVSPDSWTVTGGDSDAF